VLAPHSDSKPAASAAPRHARGHDGIAAGVGGLIEKSPNSASDHLSLAKQARDLGRDMPSTPAEDLVGVAGERGARVVHAARRERELGHHAGLRQRADPSGGTSISIWRAW